MIRMVLKLDKASWQSLVKGFSSKFKTSKVLLADSISSTSMSAMKFLRAFRLMMAGRLRTQLGTEMNEL